MKQRILFLFLSLFLVNVALAQVKNHAKWTEGYSPKNPKVGDVVELTFTATLDEGWYIYSSKLKVEGPEPTTFTFTKNNNYQLVGGIVPVGFKDHFEEVWDGNVSTAIKTGIFKQKIKILKENPILKVNVKYQTCSDQCVQGEHDFELNVKTAKGNGQSAVGNRQSALSSGESAVNDSQSVIGNGLSAVGDSSQKLKNGTSTLQDSKAERRPLTSGTPPAHNSQLKTQDSKEQSLWAFLLACFLGGLASIFMPCIYPIMPMTVSFFTKQEGGKGKIILYGISIIAIYTFFGFLVSLIGGAEAANFISTHWLPNAIFFIVFVLFGLSFLGLFEIVLPSSLVNNIDKQADRGGLAGIFFMALTLVVVSFSCTGPIASSLLIEASKGEQFLRPILGMAFYALPFALVFSGLAMFPSLLKTLPKSGGWLNEFKVVFGLLEFALALKFLSNIDLAYRWQILDREIFLAIWIVLFSFIGFYVMGKIRLEKDSEVKTLSIPRIMLSVALFSFVMYMIPGMFGAPLRGLSGWLPPEQTQDFYLTNNGTATTSAVNADSRKPHFPHGLNGYFDYNEALAEAKKQNKPLFVDFTGFACANCRKMEANVWPKPEVLSKLQNDYILVSLYIDDKTELPENQKYVSSYDKKQKTTVGARNTDLQITKFNNNAQPYYCLLDKNGNSLTPPVGVTSTDEFVQFLNTGLSNFKK